MAPLIWYCICFVPVILFLISTAFNYLLRLLLPADNKNPLPPSPPGRLPLIGHLHLLRKPLHRTFAAVSAAHGPVLLLHLGSRPALLVSSYAAAEECFTRNDAVFANRPRLLAGKLLGFNYTTVNQAPYGPHWRNLRRLTTLEVFSSHCISASSAARRQEIRSLCRHLFDLTSSAGDGRSPIIVNLKEAFFNLVLKMMSRLAVGRKLAGEKEESGKIREIVEETFSVLGISNIGDFFPGLNWLNFGYMKRLVLLSQKRNALLQHLLDTGRTAGSNLGGGTKKPFLHTLLSLQQSDPNYYDDNILKGLIVMMFTAGTDTSAATMEWAMTLLLRNPHVLDKVKAEIDSYIGEGELRLIEESDLPNLPFLQAIVNETLRLHPAGPLLVPHESSQDSTVAGYHVPKGTTLFVNAWAMQRDGTVWPEPYKFMPERFMDKMGDKYKFMPERFMDKMGDKYKFMPERFMDKMGDKQQSGGGDFHGLNYMPFGMGRRSCPGANLATRVIGIVLGTLIQCFEWDKVGDEEIDMKEKPGLTAPKAEPLMAICRPNNKLACVLSCIQEDC